MNSSNSAILIGEKRSITRAQFLSLLETYNCYLKENKNLQLSFHEDEGQIVVEGVLNISWGVHQPIRLKIQDEKQVLSYATLRSPEPSGKRGMTRWGEFDDLCHIDEMEETKQETAAEDTKDNRDYDSGTLKPYRVQDPVEESPVLYRTMSDASLVKKRVKSKTAAERQSAHQHRCSINGHFYNYKTSIFTPIFGSVTNVRINTRMTTQEVIVQLLQKFKVENDHHEFALYCIHASGEKRKLKESDFPLWERLLQGPSAITQIFLMDRDEQEVSNDVAQYLQLEMPLLKIILDKLKDEENREIQRIVTKYQQRKRNITQQIHSKNMPKTETTV
ncbi:ras association domain-containing protein 6 [Huso huso]|uniref:Ras association domain-containing protein 6 n=1 Tax=Huso huso TaxID=61971 RepID=A0ABR1A7I8_HUSHU